MLAIVMAVPRLEDVAVLSSAMLAVSPPPVEGVSDVALLLSVSIASPSPLGAGLSVDDILLCLFSFIDAPRCFDFNCSMVGEGPTIVPLPRNGNDKNGLEVGLVGWFWVLILNSNTLKVELGTFPF